MDIIIKRLYVGIILLLFIAHYTCEARHDDIFDTINEYANKSRVIDGFFKPERTLGEGYSAAVWNGK